jgi:hypothetical protein
VPFLCSAWPIRGFHLLAPNLSASRIVSDEMGLARSRDNQRHSVLEHRIHSRPMIKKQNPGHIAAIREDIRRFSLCSRILNDGRARKWSMISMKFSLLMQGSSSKNPLTHHLPKFTTI